MICCGIIQAGMFRMEDDRNGPHAHEPPASDDVSVFGDIVASLTATGDLVTQSLDNDVV